MKCLFGVAVSLMALGFQGGCATPALWTAATREDVAFHHVDGIEHCPVGDGRGGRMIVRYWGYACSDVVVHVSLEPSGLPAAPMVYTGTARTIEAIEKELSEEQAARIEGLVFEQAADNRAKRKSGGGAFVAFGERYNYFYLRNADVVAVVMRPDGTVIGSEYGFGKEPFPTDARVILLPGRHPRPEAERKAATVKAVLLAPPAVALDAVLIPVGFVMRLLRGC